MPHLKSITAHYAAPKAYDDEEGFFALCFGGKIFFTSYQVVLLSCLVIMQLNLSVHGAIWLDIRSYDRKWHSWNGNITLLLLLRSLTSQLPFMKIPLMDDELTRRRREGDGHTHSNKTNSLAHPRSLDPLRTLPLSIILLRNSAEPRADQTILYSPANNSGSVPHFSSWGSCPCDIVSWQNHFLYWNERDSRQW